MMELQVLEFSIFGAGPPQENFCFTKVTKIYSTKTKNENLKKKKKKKKGIKCSLHIQNKISVYKGKTKICKAKM